MVMEGSRNCPLAACGSCAQAARLSVEMSSGAGAQGNESIMD